MELSIVIVNYNVKYFIEQCLHSVQKAIRNIDAEVIVVDNNSVDGSCSMIRDKFPWVKLIENKQNLGFSRANNLALKNVRGEFSLLLNPDTIVEEDTFNKCIKFMQTRKNAGALGVHMIDGRGKFLPESKRALPSPAVSFYKIFGLAALFPKSRVFGKYHMGYLPEDQINKVDILSGAFMFIRTEVLHKIGYLDETFFMYGEDIDLSYRIKQAGYDNYYFPETTIIHYKGESTKKGSINYVMVFYRAMIIFARKHFSRKNARFFSLLINIAIYFRAFLSILKRFFQKIYQPLADFIFIYAGFYFLTPTWEKLQFGTKNYFPDEYLFFILPGYVVIWLLSIYYSGGYERPMRVWNVIKGHIYGTFIILVIYALLPESFRYSRALLLLGSLWALIALLIHRLALNLAGFKAYEFYGNKQKRVLLVGRQAEIKRVTSILEKTQMRTEVIGSVSPAENTIDSSLGSLSQLEEIITVHAIDEIIFCPQDIPAGEIIKYMTLLQEKNIEYKVAPPESISIIGSKSINTAGDLYLIHFNSVGKGKNRRLKRLFDILTSGMIIILVPIFIFFIRKYAFLTASAAKVLLGRYTWVSYSPGVSHEALPSIKHGIFSVFPESRDGDTGLLEKMNLEYARDYKMSNDFGILWKNILLLK